MTGRRLAHEWMPLDIPDNVVLGEGSFVYSVYAFLYSESQQDPAVVIGNHSGIYEYTQFCLGPSGRVEMGEYCTVGGTIFATNRQVILGDCVMIAWGSVVADDELALPGGGDAEGPSVVLGDNVWVGSHARLFAGTSIGNDSIVAAGSYVRGAVPPGVIVAGNPARIIGKVGDRP